MRFALFTLIACLLTPHDILPLNQLNPLKEIFRNRPWEFMEEYFIIKPLKERDNWLAVFKRSLATLAGMSVASSLSYIGSSTCIPKKVGDLQFPAQDATIFFGVPIAAIIGGIVSHSFSTRLMQESIAQKTLLMFIKEWDENRLYTPTQFHTTFEFLSKQYLTHPQHSYKNESSCELFALIQKAIYQQFPTKYSNKLKELDDHPTQTFFHAIFTCDIGYLVGSLAELVKLFILERAQ